MMRVIVDGIDGDAADRGVGRMMATTTRSVATATTRTSTSVAKSTKRNANTANMRNEVVGKGVEVRGKLADRKHRHPVFGKEYDTWCS